MKLLQICNVANICGGTFGCVYSIAKCLPDWEHEAIAVNSGEGSVGGETAELFPGKVSRKRPPLTSKLFESSNPDVIIFHNTAEHVVPQHLPAGTPRFFYQHSASGACKGARRRCDVFWCVSKALSDIVGIDYEMVLYQPVPCPPKIVLDKMGVRDTGRKHLVVGMICNADKAKWKESVDIHDFLHREHPDIWWEFVGCPDGLVDETKSACDNRATFIDIAYESRRRMWQWDIMLYHSKIPESYGRTVCEAQRTGCIPVVTKLGGFKEKIVNGQDGFLCAHHEDFSIALRILKQDDIRKQMSENAMESGSSRGSLKSWRNSFLNWFQASLEK